jgi:hypothetical protein
MAFLINEFKLFCKSLKDSCGFNKAPKMLCPFETGVGVGIDLGLWYYLGSLKFVSKFEKKKVLLAIPSVPITVSDIPSETVYICAAFVGTLVVFRLFYNVLKRRNEPVLKKINVTKQQIASYSSTTKQEDVVSTSLVTQQNITNVNSNNANTESKTIEKSFYSKNTENIKKNSISKELQEIAVKDQLKKINPWFWYCNDQETLETSNKDLLIKHSLELNENLPKTMPLEAFFTLCLLKTSKSLLAANLDKEQVIMLTYLIIPSAANIGALAHVANKIKEFKGYNLYITHILSHDLQESLKNSYGPIQKGVSVSKMTKIVEQLGLAKVNKNFKYKLEMRTENQSLTNVYNISRNREPDYIMPLSEATKKRLSQYKQEPLENIKNFAAIDCKEISHGKVNDGTLVRIFHTKNEILRFLKEAHASLISEIDYKIKIVTKIELIERLQQYKEGLENNLNLFNQSQNYDEALKIFIELFEEYLDVVIIEDLCVNIPDILTIFDLSENTKELREIFLQKFFTKFQVGSKTFDDVCEKLKNKSTMVFPREDRFIIDFLLSSAS